MTSDRRYPIPKGKGAGIHIHKPGVYNNELAAPVIPGKWNQEPAHKVVAELKETRRKENLPHHSFDVDGDGVVSQLDFFYASQFDKDGDGKLNKQVRLSCCEWERSAAPRGGHVRVLIRFR